MSDTESPLYRVNRFVAAMVVMAPDATTISRRFDPITLEVADLQAVVRENYELRERAAYAGRFREIGQRVLDEYWHGPSEGYARALADLKAIVEEGNERSSNSVCRSCHIARHLESNGRCTPCNIRFPEGEEK